MKNIHLILFSAFLLLFLFSSNVHAKTTFSDLQKTSGESNISSSVKKNIKNYINKSDKITIKNGLNMLLENNLSQKLSFAKKIISNIKIDGQISDWKNSGFVINDPKNDTLPLNNNQSKPKPAPTDDLKSFGFVMDDNYAYFMFQPYQIPHNQQFHYRINLINEKGNIIYAIVWTNNGDSIQAWNPSTGQYFMNSSTSGSSFANNEVFEAKVPLKTLKGLPYYFDLNAVVWHNFKNTFDFANVDFQQSISEKYKKSSADLFLQYAKKIKLVHNDPLPVVQAISDGFVYKFADNSVKKLVINDGIKMIRYGRKSIPYAFDNQKKLQDNNLKTLLTWANRSLGYGQYSNYYISNNNKLNKVAYRFMFMDPKGLSIANSLIQQNNFYDQTSLDNTINQTETWLNNIEKYRAGINYLKNVVKFYPSMQPIYEENLLEIQNHQRVIAKVNGFKIKTIANRSPTFQMEYLQQHGFYYGDCGDVTVVAQIFYKAFGIPSFALSYGSIAPNFYTNIHTFPIYYSSAKNKWFNYTHNGNPVFAWALPANNKPYQIFYTLNLPQIGSYWQYGPQDLKNNEIWISTSRVPKITSLQNWQDINNIGYSMSAFLKNILQ